MKIRSVRHLTFFIRKNKIIIYSLSVLILSLIFLLSMYIWIYIQNRERASYSLINGVSQGSAELSIEMSIPFKNDGVKNCWQEADGSWGSQYDIFIKNASQCHFLDWELEMTVPPESRIDSSWNGDFTMTPGKILIKGIEPAKTIVVNGDNNIRLGMVLYSNELVKECDFYLSGRFVRNPFKEIPFLVALALFLVSLIVLSVSLFFYRILKNQASIDNEKIESLLKLTASFIDTRDEYTKMHSSHVGDYAKKIAEAMGYDEDFQKNIYYMGMMHDVGKVLISSAILCKNGKLSDEEWEEMKKHTSYGAEILQGFAAIKGIKEAALSHHERYDGKGYPRGLKGEEIPIHARIISVADAYDAMHTDRSYRSHLTKEHIINEFEKNKGLQFDPAVADVMIELLKNNDFSI
ncbi:MAG: HD-GYP domain-containing protein [Treponema sp.]|nr:HD-GYP domain-containing protein [Treponema sp.]